MRTIGQRYELRGELASGGMATVHLARQLGAAGFARIVAVKRLHERFARDPEFVAMFLDEARLVGRIRHPNVVQTLDVVQEKADGAGPELFIVMEYVHGPSLMRLLTLTRQKMDPVPLKIASAIIVGVLHGLHEAHEAKSETGTPLGIVHRDVSPHNVLVGIDGVARVLDFGVAKAAERIASTQDGKVKGKLAYMAPEQVGGAEDIDRRTDVYAAAIVFWEVLTGLKLFHGPNEAATVKLVLDANVTAPSEHNAQVPAALDAVVLRALARDRDRRYATANDLAQAIADVIPPATASEVGAWVRATAKGELEEKTKLIAAIEAKGVSKSKSEAAKSLEAVGQAVGRSAPAKTQLVVDAAAPPPRAALAKTAPLPPGFQPPRPAPPEPPTGSGTRTAVMSSTAQEAPRARSTKLVIAAAAALGAIGTAIVAVVVVLLGSRTPAAAPAASSSAAAMPPPPACPEGMLLSPAGQFFMGSDDNSSAERPAHKVVLHAFCIDRTEVTIGDYKACSDRGACRRPPRENMWVHLTARESKTYDPLCASRGTRMDLPVNCIEWELAQAYCKTRGARLPTEAEWEYAARGQEQRLYTWGEQRPDRTLLNACGPECVKWLKAHGEPTTGQAYAEDDGFPTLAPVGSFPAGKSKLGADDMLGNVAEWVADYYALYEKDESTDPQGPESGRDRVVRGGTWNSAGADWLRATYRSGVDPMLRSSTVGFRCAKSLSSAPL